MCMYLYLYLLHTQCNSTYEVHIYHVLYRKRNAKNLHVEEQRNGHEMHE